MIIVSVCITTNIDGRKQAVSKNGHDVTNIQERLIDMKHYHSLKDVCIKIYQKASYVYVLSIPMYVWISVCYRKQETIFLWCITIRLMCVSVYLCVQKEVEIFRASLCALVREICFIQCKLHANV